MDMHKNARTLPASRALLAERYLAGNRMARVAREIGVSERRAWHWLKRYRSREDDALMDRSSRPKRSPKAISEEERAAILERRRLRWTCRKIAGDVGRSVSTVARVVRAAGLRRLRDLDPPAAPVQRYEHDHPGSLLHVDIKKLGRITGGGGLNQHDRPGRSRGGGYEFVHVCVDDHSRVAYAEILPDETAPSCVAFLESAVAWFATQGVTVEKVLTDNAFVYRSFAFKALCHRLGIKRRRIRPYHPQTNGKVERFNQTLIREWSHTFAYTSSAERQANLEPFLHFYNHHRAHTALGDQPPISRLLNNVLTLDTEAGPPPPDRYA